MKYNPVGSIFKEGDVTLKVQELPPNIFACDGCWYNKRHGNLCNYNGACFKHGHACTSGNRKDHKQVIFVQVKNDQNIRRETSSKSYCNL